MDQRAKDETVYLSLARRHFDQGRQRRKRRESERKISCHLSFVLWDNIHLSSSVRQDRRFQFNSSGHHRSLESGTDATNAQSSCSKFLVDRSFGAFFETPSPFTFYVILYQACQTVPNFSQNTFVNTIIQLTTESSMSFLSQIE